MKGDLPEATYHGAIPPRPHSFHPWEIPETRLSAGEVKKAPCSLKARLAEAATLTERERIGDMVELPPHYARFKIEPIRFIIENDLNWFQGNIVKYFMRQDAKNGMEDVRKGIRYAMMWEQFLLGNYDWWRGFKHWPKPGWLPETWGVPT